MVGVPARRAAARGGSARSRFLSGAPPRPPPTRAAGGPRSRGANVGRRARRSGPAWAPGAAARRRGSPTRRVRRSSAAGAAAQGHRLDPEARAPCRPASARRRPRGTARGRPRSATLNSRRSRLGRAPRRLDDPHLLKIRDPGVDASAREIAGAHVAAAHEAPGVSAPRGTATPLVPPQAVHRPVVASRAGTSRRSRRHWPRRPRPDPRSVRESSTSRRKPTGPSDRSGRAPTPNARSAPRSSRTTSSDHRPLV